MSTDTPTPAVYSAIAAVMAEMSSAGIGKDRKNAAQGFNFRGVDDVYNALSPVLAKHKLCMLPRVVSREVTERQTQKGGTLFYTVLLMEYDLVSGVDGSKHTIAVVGEAMDSGDKSTNKAMSAAFKYAAFQAFCIPVEGTPDADAETHDNIRQRGREHHPSFDDRERARFNAALSELGPEFAYEKVAAFCADLKRPRPSAMDGDSRAKLLAYLKSQREAYLRWFHEGTPPTTGK